jgi:hypothetical protein
VLQIFIALKKSIALAGLEPATFGSSGKSVDVVLGCLGNTRVERYLCTMILGVFSKGNNAIRFKFVCCVFVLSQLMFKSTSYIFGIKEYNFRREDIKLYSFMPKI